MAEVINSLFGVTPESLMADRESRLQAQAMKYAELDPFQRATAGIYAGANKLGGAVGGMLGAQDPEMMRLTQRQSLLQQGQPTTAQGWSDIGSKLMQSGDIQGAQEAYAKSQSLKAADLEARKTESIISKNTADQKAAATPAAIATAQRAAALKSAIPAYKAAGDYQTAKLLEDELDALTPAEKTINFGAEAERYSRQFYSKPYSSLSQPEMAKVNAKVEETVANKAPKFSFSPEIKMMNEALDWRNQILKENDDVIKQGANVRQSLNLLDQGTPFAQAAFNNTVVSAFGGDKQKSNAEIKRLVNTGALDTRIANTVTNFFEGKTTVATAQDQKAVLEAVDKVLEARYTSSADARKTKLKSAKIDADLAVPSYTEIVGSKPTSGETASYKGQTVKIIKRNPNGTITIDLNGVPTDIKPKGQ